MSGILDTRKIIMESVGGTLEEQTMFETAEEPQYEEYSDEGISIFEVKLHHAMSSAIAAGVGAVSYKNRVNSIQEGVSEHLKKNWKKYAGGAAALAAGAAAYKYRDDLGGLIDKGKKAATELNQKGQAAYQRATGNGTTTIAGLRQIDAENKTKELNDRYTNKDFGGR